MPKYRGGLHQAGRKRPVPRVRAEGMWFGMGPQEYDAHWGLYWPVQLMTEQDGHLVSSKISDESLDMPESY